MKDREWTRVIAADVRVVVTRSSTHPIEYAIMLLVERDNTWHTVRTYDNAHGIEEHHEHRYIGNTKQSPIITTGDVNAAMAAALSDIFKNWRGMVDEWERPR